jgi:hypothetical protein
MFISSKGACNLKPSQIPLMDKWIVIISNVDMIEDFYRASESQLSLQEAFRAVRTEPHATHLLFIILPSRLSMRT